MPDFMASAHARVLDKKQLDVEDQKALYHFGQNTRTMLARSCCWRGIR